MPEGQSTQKLDVDIQNNLELHATPEHPDANLPQGVSSGFSPPMLPMYLTKNEELKERAEIDLSHVVFTLDNLQLIFSHPDKKKPARNRFFEAFSKETDLNLGILSKLMRDEGALFSYDYTDEELNAMYCKGSIVLFAKMGVDRDRDRRFSASQFVFDMNQKFQKAQGRPLDLKTFKQCWNTMFDIDQETFSYLDTVAELQQKYKFHLHMIATTDEISHEHMIAQLTRHRCKLRMSFTLSFKEGELDPIGPNNAEPELKDLKFIDLRNNISVLHGINENIDRMSKQVPTIPHRQQHTLLPQQRSLSGRNR